MAEAGIAESTTPAIMGYMSRAMLERDSHIRARQARRGGGAVLAGANRGLYNFHYIGLGWPGAMSRKLLILNLRARSSGG